MKNIKTVLKRAAAVMLAAVMALTLVTGCGKKTPLQTIESGIRTLASNIGEEYSVLNTLSDAVRGGSIQVNLSLDEIVKTIVDADIKGIDGSLKLMFGEGDAALNVAAKLNGIPIADANLYVDKEGFAVTSDALLGDGTAYGSDFDGIDKRFSESIFAEDGDYDDYAGELESVVRYLAYVGKVASMVEQFNEFWPELKTAIYTAIEENSEASVQKGTYSADGDSIKTYNVAVVAKEDQICDIAQAVCDVLLDSDDFNDFCKDNRDVFELFGIEDVCGAIKEFKESADDQRGEMDGAELELYAFIGRSSKELIAFEMKLSNEGGGEREIKFVCTPSSKELKKAELLIGNGDYENIIRYDVKENTKAAYKCEVEMCRKGPDYDETDIALEYSWDKSEGDFKLELADAEIKGEITADKKKSTIAIDSVSADGVDLEFDTFEIIILAEDEITVVEDYEDILTVSAEEFEEILKPIFELVNELGAQLG